MSVFVLPQAPGKHVIVSGQRIHYIEKGSKSAPALILLHGLMDSTNAWKEVFDDLSKKFHVLAPDLPGHGYSEKRSDFSMSLPDQAAMVAGFMTALKIKSCRLIGHSMGGGIAILVASRYPKRIEKLVLVCPTCYPFRTPLKGKLGMLPHIGPLVVNYIYSRKLLTDYVRNDVYSDPANATQEEIDIMYAHFDSPEGRSAAQRAMVAIDNPAWMAEDIKKIKASSLIVWGDRDNLVPVSLSYRLEADIPDSKLHIIDRCGHMVINEQTDEFQKLIVDFLKSK